MSKEPETDTSQSSPFRTQNAQAGRISEHFFLAVLQLARVV
jgi:hypothetical protein